MPKIKLAYLWSLRNAAADQAGRPVAYRGGTRYMTSPLEHLAHALDTTPLGDAYTLEAVIHDDDAQSERDRQKLGDYGFAPRAGTPWFFPDGLATQGRPLAQRLLAVPSSYRRLPLGAAERPAAKRAYEARLMDKLLTVGAELVLIDGLLVILDELVRPGAPFHRRIVNIHPGITRADSPYERRGAWATLDALHGARGQKMDWATMQGSPVPALLKTGASFHYVDKGIDSGEVITDMLGTDIDPADTILELRWNNFNRSLFPAMLDGLAKMAPVVAAARA